MKAPYRPPALVSRRFERWGCLGCRYRPVDHTCFVFEDGTNLVVRFTEVTPNLLRGPSWQKRRQEWEASQGRVWKPTGSEAGLAINRAWARAREG